VPNSSVRRRARETLVPTLLVVGERESGFIEARTYAERTIPGLQVTALDAGHAVNLEAAGGFDQAVASFFMRQTSAAW
jgi:pimeloyl-ACP methyl ester carboxylesterase